MASWRAGEAAMQARRREQNEATARAPRADGAEGDSRAFRCECGDSQCACEIALSLSEYERVREHATRFAVARNHENPESEHVLHEDERFAIVELMTREATKLARRTDPRHLRRDHCLQEAAQGSPEHGRA